MVEDRKARDGAGTGEPADSKGPERLADARGFTLVELLVVVAIIALLVTILMPSLKRAKVLALRAVCEVNLHHIGTGCSLYAMENNGFFPHADGIYMGDTRNVFHGSMNRNMTDEFDRQVWFPGRQIQNVRWWHCLGLLHRSGRQGEDHKVGYVDPAVMYCPAEKPEYCWWYDGGRWFTLEYNQNENGWGHPYDGRQVYIEISYLYHANTGPTSVVPHQDEMIGQALVADRFTYGDRDHEEGYNAVYADGSARWCPDPDLEICTGWPFKPGVMAHVGWTIGGWEKLAE